MLFPGTQARKLARHAGFPEPDAKSAVTFPSLRVESRDVSFQKTGSERQTVLPRTASFWLNWLKEGVKDD